MSPQTRDRSPAAGADPPVGRSRTPSGLTRAAAHARPEALGAQLCIPAGPECLRACRGPHAVGERVSA